MFYGFRMISIITFQTVEIGKTLHLPLEKQIERL